ncbi:MAG: hypothetical protein WAT23_06810 [Chromatiaceae bacterium]
MRAKLRCIVALTGLVGTLSAAADDTPVDIKTDLEGQYFLVEKGGTTTAPTLLVKRVASYGTHYVERQFDCEAKTERYLGEGDSIKAVAASEPETEATAINAGSIADQLLQYVCPPPPSPVAADK